MAKLTAIKTKTTQINDAVYNDYMAYLHLLAVTVFEWKGMPETVNIRYLEEKLYEKGTALFFKDEFMGYLALACTRSGGMNIYNEGVAFQAFGTTYTKRYERDECVLIRNNYAEIPTKSMVELFTQRLYEAERTLDVNIKAQKTPKIIACTPEQKLTLLNIYDQYDGNQPVIVVDKSMDPDILRSIDTHSEYVADKVMVYKHNVLNDFVTRLGLNNVNTDKKERLLTGEVDANNELIQLSLETMLTPRKEAAEQINKMFGLNVSVDIRESLKPKEPEMERNNLNDPEDPKNQEETGDDEA
jgi:hypothetical protein